MSPFIYIYTYLDIDHSFLPSFSGEGDFVLVRKDNGVEGWTKVRNLSSALLPIECRETQRMLPEGLKQLAN